MFAFVHAGQLQLAVEPSHCNAKLTVTLFRVLADTVNVTPTHI